MEGDEETNKNVARLAGEGAQNNQILFTSFNQNQGCFACGTESGFKIFNSYPFKDCHNRSKCP